MKTAKIIGATGYGGVGMVELLLGHPEVELSALAAKDEVGKPLSEFYPHLRGHCDMEVLPASEVAEVDADIVFFCTPDGVGMQLAAAELERGAKVVDYSGDFRFNNPEEYAEYARRIGRATEHATPELLPDSAYGLPELGLASFEDKRLIGNPGCFAASVSLGFAPALKAGLVNPLQLIADCKTGVSGAGKKPKPTFHYPARYDNMNAYKLAGHQHVCEIECYLGKLAGTDVRTTFTAQVVPATRGILSCLYAPLNDGVTRGQVEEAYSTFYGNARFIRLFEATSGVGTAHQRGSNYCDLVVDIDERTRTLRVISHIDNLMKGQAGSAMQNMNLLLGLNPSLGLERPASIP